MGKESHATQNHLQAERFTSKKKRIKRKESDGEIKWHVQKDSHVAVNKSCANILHVKVK